MPVIPATHKLPNKTQTEMFHNFLCFAKSETNVLLRKMVAFFLLSIRYCNYNKYYGQSKRYN